LLPFPEIVPIASVPIQGVIPFEFSISLNRNPQRSMTDKSLQFAQVDGFQLTFKRRWISSGHISRSVKIHRRIEPSFSIWPPIRPGRFTLAP
jgi:hypothetical protein